MAIQTVDLTVPNGDTPRSANTKINLNFTDQTNAASRLAGTADNQIPLAQDIFKAAFQKVTFYPIGAVFDCNNLPKGERALLVRGILNLPTTAIDDWVVESKSNYTSGDTDQLQIATGYTSAQMAMRVRGGNGWGAWVGFYTTGNVTKDSNGFLKGASPIVDLYNDKIELNTDALKQKIGFEKIAVGDYLIKGSLGFAQEGWYIETPKDANGNVLVAVVYRQLPNNDISVKTYAKRFDEDTGDIVANLTKPRDIPAGRFISLRLHELPTEPTPAPEK